MGFFMSKAMDANLKRQQEFMLHNSRLQVSEQKCYFSINAGVILVFSYFLALKYSNCF